MHNMLSMYCDVVSVLGRVHSTTSMHNMLAMYCDVAHDNWSQLLPFVQMAHNT